MSTETLFIHILWASVSSAALYVTYRCVEKYTTVKSLEVLALASERVGSVLLQVLKVHEGRFGNFPVPVIGNGTQKRPRHPHPTSTQTKETHSPHTNPQFDLCD